MTTIILFTRIIIIDQVLNIFNRILFLIEIFLWTSLQEISCFLLHDNHGYVMLHPHITFISINWEGDQWFRNCLSVWLQLIKVFHNYFESCSVVYFWLGLGCSFTLEIPMVCKVTLLDEEDDEEDDDEEKRNDRNDDLTVRKYVLDLDLYDDDINNCNQSQCLHFRKSELFWIAQTAYYRECAVLGTWGHGPSLERSQGHLDFRFSHIMILTHRDHINTMTLILILTLIAIINIIIIEIKIIFSSCQIIVAIISFLFIIIFLIKHCNFTNHRDF